MRRFSFIALMLCLAANLCADVSPKREFRSSWITTVWAIDWPTTRGTGESVAAKQKQEFIAILNKLEDANMNAAFFQVRGMSDAFYKSSYEPWSQYLTNNRGDAPSYDPLEFAVEEAHKRGIELHAWINPYRYSSSEDNHGNLATDYAQANPEWLLSADKYTKILNPGLPEVREQITNIIAEIVANYDVDGIVFDDYFYSNGSTTDAMDQAQYDLYNPDGLSRGDWRRQNVNKMVRMVYDKIKELKPNVRFGISPAGVAATQQAVADKYGVPKGPVSSDWQYNGIYSDPLAWLSEGSIDYISPQIYWTIGSTADYAALASWWSDVAARFGKHFYSSHSLSGMTSGGKAPEASMAPYSGIEQNAVLAQEATEVTLPNGPMRANFSGNEIGNQIDCNRTSDLNDAPGSVFYATNKLVNTAGFIDYLKNNKFTEKALTPAINWVAAPIQPMVTNIQKTYDKLEWQSTLTNVRYAVYYVPENKVGEPGTFAQSTYLLGVSYINKMTVPMNTAAGYTFAVAVIDGHGNEYAPRVMQQAEAASVACKLTYPQADSEALMPCYFTWEAVDKADSYVWQVAHDAAFADLITSRETIEPKFSTSSLAVLQDGERYYWRVRTRRANALDVWSDGQAFSSNEFSILSPANGEQKTALAPTFVWEKVDDASAQYTLEISTSGKFEANKEVYKVTTSATQHQIPDETLIASTNYYARVTVAYGSIVATSSTTVFSTMDLEVPIPVILTPTANAVLYGDSICVTWTEQHAKGFRVELSASESFPPRGTKVKTADPYTFQVTYTDMAPDVYYVRILAQEASGYTDPSEVVQFELKAGTSLDDVEVNDFSFYPVFTGKDNLQLHLNNVHNDEVKVLINTISGVNMLHNIYKNVQDNINIPINLHNFTHGIYVITVETENARKTKKIVLSN